MVAYDVEEERFGLRIEGCLLVQSSCSACVPVGGNAGAGGNHNEICGRVLLRHEHDFASGAGEHHFVTRLRVA